MKKKLKLALIFGGASGEHEVSLQSAAAVLGRLDPNKYAVTPIKISRNGRNWPGPEVLKKFDVVFPLIHGTGGEDGCLQGLLELAGVAYVGSGVLGSALGMDKVVQKKLLAAAGLPVAAHLSYRVGEWGSGSRTVLAEIERELGFPNFVKPANLGSSVGVSKAHHRRELRRALDEAFLYDTKVIVERAVPQAREIECGVIGHEEPRTSVLGEVIPANEFYDYAAKYLAGGSRTVIPAAVTRPLERKLRRLAVQTFRTLEASGLARVDFLVSRETGEAVINEINTIPGFTRHSMFPELWQASGLAYGPLLDELIELALDRAAQARRLRRSYSPATV